MSNRVKTIIVHVIVFLPACVLVMLSGYGLSLFLPPAVSYPMSLLLGFAVGTAAVVTGSDLAQRWRR